MTAVEEALAAHKAMNEARRSDYETRQADFDAHMPEEVLLDDWAYFEANPGRGYRIRKLQPDREPWLGRWELNPKRVQEVIVARYVASAGIVSLHYQWRQSTEEDWRGRARPKFWEGFKVVQPLRWEVPEGLYK